MRRCITLALALATTSVLAVTTATRVRKEDNEETNRQGQARFPGSHKARR